MVPFVSSKTSKLLGLVGALQDFESVFVFKNLLNSVGSTSLSFEGMAEQTLLDLRHMYIMDPLFHEWS